MPGVTDDLIDLYRRTAVLVAQQPVALVLLGLVLGFVVIRTSTRLIRANVRWWPGNVTVGRVHVHHEFVGVLLMLVTGTLAFVVPDASSWYRVLAFSFGAGAGLVLDEFALLLHLDDVYWTHEGRSSIDAVLVAVALGLMLVLGAAPFGRRTPTCQALPAAATPPPLGGWRSRWSSSTSP